MVDVIETTGKIMEGGVGEMIGNSAGMFGFGSLSKIVLIIFVVGVLGILGFMYYLNKKSKTQWTHILNVYRVIDGNRLTKPMQVKMRRFPLIKEAEVFQLETAVLGSFLFPEPDKYTGKDQYDIVIDDSNRLYTPKDILFNKDKGSVEISCKHAGLDIAFSELKSKYQELNQVTKKIDLREMVKWGVLMFCMILITIVLIKGIGAWTEAKEFDKDKAIAEAETMEILAGAMITIDSAVNTQGSVVLPLIKEIYGTENIQEIMNKNRVLEIDGTI